MQHLKTMLLTVESIEKLKYVTVADVQTVQKQGIKMGKKKSREKYTSKGIVGSPMKSSTKQDPGYAFRRSLNQRIAWKEGRNVVLTIPNPNDKETNKPFIRVNARQVWGDPRRQGRV